jgi:acyl dehydratase
VTTQMTIEELEAAGERDLGTSGWWRIDQHAIDLFAEATGDDQWIHVDPERAAAGPFGGTVAHGYLSLSLLPALMREVLAVTGARMGVNYGLNRVRFTGPVPAGARVRARFVLDAVEDIKGGVQLTWNVSVEREGEEKPVLVAEWLTRRYY